MGMYVCLLSQSLFLSLANSLSLSLRLTLRNCVSLRLSFDLIVFPLIFGAGVSNPLPYQDIMCLSEHVQGFTSMRDHMYALAGSLFFTGLPPEQLLAASGLSHPPPLSPPAPSFSSHTTRQ